MANLLEQAINSNDGDRAVKLIQNALGLEAIAVANYSSRKHGRTTASNGPASSANGFRPKRVFLPDAVFLPILPGCRCPSPRLRASFAEMI